MSDEKDMSEDSGPETGTIDADAHRLARIMIAEARRVATQEAAEHVIDRLTDAKWDVERDIVGRLTGFLYLLIRDHVTVGAANELVKHSMGENVYSDDILRAKAESLATMLACGEYHVKDMVATISEKAQEDDDEKGCEDPA